MSKSVENATKIVNLCRELGWTFEVSRSILTIYKNIQQGSTDDLVRADMEYFSILSLLKRSSSGSDWGTDCGGIGADYALVVGRFVMKRSGGNKNTLRALAKMS